MPKGTSLLAWLTRVGNSTMLPALLLLAMSYGVQAAVLTPVETVNGEIFDVDQSRVLYLHRDGSLRIRDRNSGTEVTIPPPAAADRVPMYGYLTPRGAIFQADNGVLNSGIYDWADGRLFDLGQPNSSISLVVNGSYAIWSADEFLILRDLQSGTNDTIANDAGNLFNDVTEDGRVVYWKFTPYYVTPPDINLFWYGNGVSTRLTQDSYYANLYPLTDGSRIVYRKSEPCCDGRHQISLLEDSVEISLGPWRTSEPSPELDYQVNGGWVAYTTKPGWWAGDSLWLRAPDGKARQLAPDVDNIEDLAPDGQVTWIEEGTRARYLWAGGPDAIPLGTWSVDRSLWVDGLWYVISDGVLYEVDLSRDSVGRNYDVEVLADVNGNGASDIAVMSIGADGQPQVTIRDGFSKALISEVTFAAGEKSPVGVTGVSDLNGNGSPELALLMIKPDGRGRVHIKDAATGRWVNKVNALSSEWKALAIASLDLNRDDISEVAILGQKDDGSAVAVQVIDSRSGKQLNWIGFPASIRYVDVSTLPDSNGNGSPEVAALYALDDLTQRIVIKDAATDALINVVDSDVNSKSTLGLTSLADIDGNGIAELALLLGRPDGRARVWIKDAMTGRWVARLKAFDGEWQSMSIGARNAGDRRASSKVAILAIRDDGSRGAVHVKDPVDGAQNNWIGFTPP